MTPPVRLAALVLSVSLCLSTAALAQAIPPSGGAAAFFRLCGAGKGDLGQAVALAEGSSWTRVTPEQIGMTVPPGAFRSLEMLRGVGAERNMILMTHVVDRPDQGLSARTCSITIYPSGSGESVPDPTAEVAAWVGVPADQAPDREGGTMFYFLDGNRREPVGDLDGQAIEAALQQGRLHSVGVVYAPAKTMIQYSIPTVLAD